jgi:hypothetical protein
MLVVLQLWKEVISNKCFNPCSNSVNIGEQEEEEQGQVEAQEED